MAAPKQRNTEAEKAAIKAGCIPEAWVAKPAKLRQKDRDGLPSPRLLRWGPDARWTVKCSKAKPREDGALQADLAVLAFGYKNHVSVDEDVGVLPPSPAPADTAAPGCSALLTPPWRGIYLGAGEVAETRLCNCNECMQRTAPYTIHQLGVAATMKHNENRGRQSRWLILQKRSGAH